MSENLYTTDGGTWPWPRYEDYSQVPPENQEEEEDKDDDHPTPFAVLWL